MNPFSHFDIDNSPLMLKFVSEFGFRKFEIALLIRSAPRRYKIYPIPKRKEASYRLIAQPSAELKFLQRWLVNGYLNEFPVHESAMAYEVGKSIKDNAACHASNKYLMKLDFKDFFPSIVSSDFVKFLKKTDRMSGLTRDDIIGLCRVLFMAPKGSQNLKLSIGAPSSPKISNIIMYDFDKAVSEYCASKNIIYTRYADDLTFSTSEPKILNDCRLEIARILKSLRFPKLFLNEEKTVFSSKKYNRRVTGLILTNDGKVSLGREKKKLIRAQIDYFRKGKLTHEEILRLKGHLAYAFSVEKEFVDNMKRKYEGAITKIFSYRDE